MSPEYLFTYTYAYSGSLLLLAGQAFSSCSEWGLLLIVARGFPMAATALAVEQVL